MGSWDIPELAMELVEKIIELLLAFPAMLYYQPAVIESSNHQQEFPRPTHGS
jgi:hypothetical protein